MQPEEEEALATDDMLETASDWSASERESRASQRTPGGASGRQGVRPHPSDALLPPGSPRLSGFTAPFGTPLSTPPGSPLLAAVRMTAAGYMPNELPITFEGQMHIMTDLTANTTCNDLIQALLRYKALLPATSPASSTSSPLPLPHFPCVPSAPECDVYVVRHGERRRRINRGVRIQTFYRHYVQRHAADTFYLEVCRREGLSTLTRRRNLNVCHACGNQDRPSSPDASQVEFFDAEAARKAKEDAETRKQLLKTIDRQTQDLERLQRRILEVEAQISEVEWKILPSRNLPECLAHYDRIHRCNRRLLEEHEKIRELSAQVEAAKTGLRSKASKATDEPAPLRRTFSASSVMDLADLSIPPPKAFDDCPAPTYVNFPMRRPGGDGLPATVRYLNIHSSQPLQNCHQPIRQHHKKAPTWSTPSEPVGGGDSDTGLGSLSDEAGCIGPVETLV